MNVAGITEAPSRIIAGTKLRFWVWMSV